MSMVEFLIKGDGEAMARLLGEGIPADSQDERGNSALHLAAGLGYTDYVNWLLEAGATVNLTNRVRQTPLHFAARYGRLEAVQVLLEKGADPAILDQSGRTAWALAKRENHAEILAVLPADGVEEAPTAIPVPAVQVAQNQGGMVSPEAVAAMPRDESKKPGGLGALLAKLKGGKGKKPRSKAVLIVELVLVAILVATIGVYFMAFQTRMEMTKKRKLADEAVIRADQLSKELGDDTMAAPELLNAMVIDPDYSVIYYKYAAIQAKLGSLEEADQFYKLGAEAADRELKNASIHKTAWQVFARFVGLEKKNLDAGLIPPGQMKLPEAPKPEATVPAASPEAVSPSVPPPPVGELSGSAGSLP